MSAIDGMDELHGMKQQGRRQRQALPPAGPKKEMLAPVPPQSGPIEEEHHPIQEEPVTTATAPTPHAATSSTGGITVYLTTEAVEGARKMRSAGVTNGHIALLAIEALQDRLHELVAARRGSDRKEAITEPTLFPPRSGTAAKSSKPRRTMWSVRLTPAEIDVLQRLVAATGAASRSELVSVAVEAYVGSHSAHQ
jgi:hypothetical protein